MAGGGEVVVVVVVMVICHLNGASRRVVWVHLSPQNTITLGGIPQAKGVNRAGVTSHGHVTRDTVYR